MEESFVPFHQRSVCLFHHRTGNGIHDRVSVHAWRDHCKSFPTYSTSSLSAKNFYFGPFFAIQVNVYKALEWALFYHLTGGGFSWLRDEFCASMVAGAVGFMLFHLQVRNGMSLLLS
jgi:hypothetical protein